MLRWLVIWLAISGGAGVMADESGESGEANKAGEVGEAAAAALDPIATLMQSLPDETIKKLRSKPAKFIETSADLIYGYGTDGGIDLGGIDNFIAVRRSAIRARAVAKLLEADLDNDGTVTLREVDILAATQAARIHVVGE